MQTIIEYNNHFHSTNKYSDFDSDSDFDFDSDFDSEYYFDPCYLIDTEPVPCETNDAIEKVDMLVIFNERRYHIETLVHLPENISEINMATISNLVSTVPKLDELLRLYKTVYITHNSKIFGVICYGWLDYYDFSDLPSQMHDVNKSEHEYFGVRYSGRDYFITLIKNPIEINQTKHN